MAGSIRIAASSATQCRIAGWLRILRAQAAAAAATTLEEEQIEDNRYHAAIAAYAAYVHGSTGTVHPMPPISQTYPLHLHHPAA